MTKVALLKKLWAHSGTTGATFLLTPKPRGSAKSALLLPSAGEDAEASPSALVETLAIAPWQPEPTQVEAQAIVNMSSPPIGSIARSCSKQPSASRAQPLFERVAGSCTASTDKP